MAKPLIKKILQNLILLTISCLFTLLILEIALRIMKDDKYYIWNPNMKATLTPLPNLFPGITGESRFIVNSEGFRGDDIPETVDFKIIAVGGSTTECTYLDQEEAWPYLIQKNLSQSLNKSVWVGNAGKSGMTNYEHIVQVEELLKQYPDIDLVMILIGINDFQKRLSLNNNYKTLQINQKIYNRAFDHLPEFNPDLPIYKKTELWSSLSKLKYLFIEAEHEQDSEGKTLQTWRENRQSASKILNELPDLTVALDNYENALKRIIEITAKHKTKLVFISQPVIWHKGLPKELEQLCWFGGVGNYQSQKGNEYFSIEVLEKGMNLYNQRLKKVCEANSIFLIDISDKLPKDTTVFYDDCHFNENGSIVVAELISKEIKKILE